MKLKYRVGIKGRRRRFGKKQLLGVGASVATLVGVGQAEASVIHNDPEDTTIGPGLTNNNLGMTLSNLVNNSVKNPDFAFNVNDGDVANLSFQSLNNASQAILNPLNFNDVITSDNFGDGLSGFNFNLGSISKVTNDTSNGSNNATGNWVGVSNAYLGVQIDVPGSSPHLGWVELSVNAALELTVHEFAIESETNKRIRAGQTQNSPVPEPGTLGLLALGAIGISAWRTRRSV